MTGKPITPKLSVPIVIFLFLCLGIGSALAGGRKASDLRGRVYVQRCEIPYNIDDYGYTTGLHIVPDWTGDVTIALSFYCGGEPYATRNIVVPPEGITITAQALLPAGYKLKFPTLIYAEMVHPGSNYEGEHFWVTQFLFTGSGFSHQTFESHDY
jgi:hypothetical protein